MVTCSEQQGITKAASVCSMAIPVSFIRMFEWSTFHKSSNTVEESNTTPSFDEFAFRLQVWRWWGLQWKVVGNAINWQGISPNSPFRVIHAYRSVVRAFHQLQARSIMRHSTETVCRCCSMLELCTQTHERKTALWRLEATSLQFQNFEAFTGAKNQ